MLRRVNARLLREDAGFSPGTVAAAFGVSQWQVYAWEAGRWLPRTAAGFRWAAFMLALERRARVTAEIAAELEEAA